MIFKQRSLGSLFPKVPRLLFTTQPTPSTFMDLFYFEEVIYIFLYFSFTINPSNVQINAGNITKVAIKAKDILITVIRPKSFNITNFEIIKTLNPPTVVNPDVL